MLSCNTKKTLNRSGKKMHIFCGQVMAFKTGPRLPREARRWLQWAERNSSATEESHDIYLKGATAASSDAILIKLKRWQRPVSKYPPVCPAAALSLILHFFPWTSIVFCSTAVESWGVLYLVFPEHRISLYRVSLSCGLDVSSR